MSKEKSFCSRFFIISCKKYTEILNKKIDGEKLSQKDSFSFSLHHIVCTFCRRFNKQIQLIDFLSKSCATQTNQNEINVCLSKEKREKILNELNKENKH